MSRVCNCKDCDMHWSTPGTMYRRNGDPGDPPDEGCSLNLDEDTCSNTYIRCDQCGRRIADDDVLAIDDNNIGQYCFECANDIKDGKIRIRTQCPCCSKVAYVNATKVAYVNWKYKGMLIQEAFPGMSTVDRELIKTGLCKGCFPDDE